MKPASPSGVGAPGSEPEPGLLGGIARGPNLWVAGLRALRSLTEMLAYADMSQVVYARVPETLKDALDTYSVDRGVTLTSAVVDLLGRGMAAASDERSVAELEAKLARVSTEKVQVEAKLATATNELGGLQAFAQRAVQAVGTCPNPSCGKSITGYDLLALGWCHHCQQTLMDLLAPHTNNTSLNQRDVGLLLGALGVALIGAAIIGSAAG